MSLISFIGIGIALVILVMALLIIKSIRKNSKEKPYLLSLSALSLIILNWVLYLLGFYAMLPERIGDLIFMPIWFLVCIIGIIVALKEFRNNLTFAVLNGGLSIISSIFGILLLIIGSM